MRNPFAVAASRVMASPTRRASSWGPAGAYAGAAIDRLNGDWLMSRLSADQALRPNLTLLRDRSRDLVANNSTASRVPQLFSENVIGKDGILLQAQVGNTRGGVNEGVNGKIEAAWYRWCEAQNASVDGRSSFTDLERLLVESECTDGEVLLRIVDGADNEFGFALEVLDADQLDHLYNVLPSPGRNEIRMGIEVDRWQRPVRYWFWANHPSEPGGMIRVPVPAEDVIHLYIKRRPKQSRGLPWFTPVIIDLKNLGAYRTAEVIQARIAATKGGFFESDPEAKALDATDGEQGEQRVSFMAEPGLFEQLPPGLHFKEWTPEHPTTAFEAFDKAILRSVASAVRVSYMSLSGDLQGTSYGSGRIGLLAERAVYQALQQRLIEHVHTRVYRRWLRMALLSGALALDSFDSSRYEEAQWHPRSFPWIDPQKDIDAAQKEVGMGINSLTRLAAERGRDIESVLQERQREIELAKKYNVPLILAPDSRVASAEATTSDAADEGGAPTDGSAPANDKSKNGTHPGALSRFRVRLLGGGQS